MNQDSSSPPLLPWFDYQSRHQSRIPQYVKYLRIGFVQCQELLQGQAPPAIEIEGLAFSQHPNLKQVQIYLPAVSRIGNGTFDSCGRLEKVEFLIKPKTAEKEHNYDNALPSKLVSIGGSAFGDCFNIRSIIGLEQAKGSLIEIEPFAFYCCHSLANVNFLSSLVDLRALGRLSFAKNKTLTTIDLSKAIHLTTLEKGIFRCCHALTTIHFPPNLLSIADYVFSSCRALEYIHLPPNLQRIGEEVFKGCGELKAIVLPSSLCQIGIECFHDCTKLSHIALPSPSVPFLKSNPFNNHCTSLSSLELPTQVVRNHWPLILEQFCEADGIASVDGGISSSKNRNTIVWNFLCQNMAQLFIVDNAAMSRRRPAQQL